MLFGRFEHVPVIGIRKPRQFPQSGLVINCPEMKDTIGGAAHGQKVHNCVLKCVLC